MVSHIHVSRQLLVVQQVLLRILQWQYAENVQCIALHAPPQQPAQRALLILLWSMASVLLIKCVLNIIGMIKAATHVNHVHQTVLHVHQPLNALIVLQGIT